MYYIVLEGGERGAETDFYPSPHYSAFPLCVSCH